MHGLPLRAQDNKRERNRPPFLPLGGGPHRRSPRLLPSQLCLCAFARAACARPPPASLPCAAPGQNATTPNDAHPPRPTPRPRPRRAHAHAAPTPTLTPRRRTHRRRRLLPPCPFAAAADNKWERAVKCILDMHSQTRSIISKLCAYCPSHVDEVERQIERCRRWLVLGCAPNLASSPSAPPRRPRRGPRPPPLTPPLTAPPRGARLVGVVGGQVRADQEARADGEDLRG